MTISPGKIHQRNIVSLLMADYIKSLFSYRKIVWSLAKSDFQSRYLGSTLGIFWAFILPLVNLAIMWFAFQHGLRASPKNGLPFILWLVTGIFPWAFFSDAVLSASNSIIEKSYLVKKVVFRVELLPPIKIIGSMFPFLFLSLVMLLLFVLYGFGPTLYWLQVPYYLLCLLVLVLSLSWFTSSIVVFYRDLGQIIGMVLQMGFWVTPIFWSPEHIPAQFRFISFINPMAYVIGGYRNSLILNIWFWEEPLNAVCFWSFVVCFGMLGFFLFKRLRPHFADIL